MERIKRLVASAESAASANGHVMRAFNYYSHGLVKRQRANSECIHCGKEARASVVFGDEAISGDAVARTCNQLYTVQRQVLRERVHNKLLTMLQPDSEFFKVLDNALMCPSIIGRLRIGERDQELQDMLLTVAITKVFRYRRNIDRKLFSTLMRYRGKKHTKHVTDDIKCDTCGVVLRKDSKNYVALSGGKWQCMTCWKRKI